MKYLLSLLTSVLFSYGLMAQNPSLHVGSSAPEISLSQPNGKVLSLSSLKGSLVLVDFWATWCAPCVKEQPELKAIYQQYDKYVKEGKFQILGVSLDKKKDSWEKAINSLKLTWPQVSDLKFWNSPVANTYGIEALPFNVIVDEKGNIAATNLHGKELANFIKEYLEKLN